MARPVAADMDAPLFDAADAARWRRDFPVFATPPDGEPVIYLDSAASAQKPHAVIAAMRESYERAYANIHRASHRLGAKATERYETARQAVQRFINARHSHEIIFTGNATQAINLVAHSWGRHFIDPGRQSVLVSEMEHHSNFVPWQMLRDSCGVALHLCPVNMDGTLSLEQYRRILETETVALVAIAHVSNVLGTVNPVKDLITLAHDAGAMVLVDGSQAAPHIPIDVQNLDADFYVFTGHKLYGPSGIGVLYGKEACLDRMPPFLGGGEMISSVSFAKSEWAELPWKFEAGTPPIVQAPGLHAAIDYVSSLGLDRIAAHETELLEDALTRLSALDGIRMMGYDETSPAAGANAPLVSFWFEDVHAQDIAEIIGRKGIAVRDGKHCAEPLMERFGVSSSLRASFALYNNCEDILKLEQGLKQALSLLRN